jgi:NitT/TauT family transport system substrate-binding protein
MKHFRILLVIVMAALVVAACQPAAQSTETEAPQVQEEAAKAPAAEEPSAMEPVAIKIAVLPIIDTLPLYVAQQQGFFANHGVEVELIPVASAPERVQLVASGQVDGTINETLAVMQFNKETVTMQAVRYALRPAEGYGHFFILASGASGITAPEGLKGVEVGVSQGTIIEYVTERLLQAEGLNADEIKTIPVPKIPDRMALLASGELSAGTLPDPLGALAVQSGAVIVMDDAAHPEYGFSIYSFRKEFIDAHPEAVKGFLAAVDEAVALINSDPTQYTSILSEAKIVPPPLLDAYKVPPFPTAGIPTEAEWLDALDWAKSKGMLDVDVSYADSVTDAYLP